MGKFLNLFKFFVKPVFLIVQNRIFFWKVNDIARKWTFLIWQTKLSQKTRWLGVKVWQWPTDLFAVQELLYNTKPDFVVETGTADGGSALFCASIFELLNHGKVISIDLDIHRAAKNLEDHFLRHRIRLIEGDSKSQVVFEKIKRLIGNSTKVHVFLDSCHSASHVKAELDTFSKIVKPGGYIVVFDTSLADTAESKNDNPMIAVKEFLKENKSFVVDKYWEKYKITFCRRSFLRRVT